MSLTQSPVSQMLGSGQSSVLECGWSSDQDTAQVSWTRDGVPVSGAVSQLSNGSLRVSMDRAGDNVGVYQCRVSRPDVGTVLSTPASVNLAGDL